MGGTCKAQVFNVVAVLGTVTCTECREAFAMLCVCPQCSDWVCLACLPRHVVPVERVEDTDHVASNDDRERSHPE